MSRSALDRITDIRRAFDAIREHELLGRSAPAVFDAVRMRLLEIGEAVNGIPASLRETESQLPWAAMVGMRNWTAHRYFDTLHDYVWVTVDRDLGPLLDALTRIEARLTGR